jgi:hypothetical protein
VWICVLDDHKCFHTIAGSTHEDFPNIFFGVSRVEKRDEDVGTTKSFNVDLHARVKIVIAFLYFGSLFSLSVPSTGHAMIPNSK